MADKEKQIYVREVVQSEGWGIILSEIINPYCEQLLHELEEVDYREAARAPVIAAKRQAVKKILDMINDYIE